MTGITLDGLARMRSRWRCGADLTNGQMEDLFDAVEHALTEQSRIDEAVAKERERCADELLFWRDATPTFTGAWHDGRRAGLETAAAIVRAMAPDAPTPTTEEGA